MNAFTPTKPDATGTPARSRAPVRVFIVDDSSTIRAIYSRMIDREPSLELVGTASSGEDALSQLGGLLVHVVLLDLEMPGMGGMRALPEIIKRTSGAKVLIVSTLTKAGAKHTVQALSLGAADTLQKPAAGCFDETYRRIMVDKIHALGWRPLRRATTDGTLPAPVWTLRPPSLFRSRVVGIGASTGGIHAISALLVALPDRIGVPILITQHLPVEFGEAFARQLHECSGRRVAIAEEGMPLVADSVIVSPGDAHLCLRRTGKEVVVSLDHEQVASRCLPSVDPMFASLAEHYGPHALGIVLTGMGRDGTDGARALVNAGGNVIIQNEASSVVWGMPGSVAKAGLATAMLHPRDIAARLVVCTEPS